MKNDWPMRGVDDVRRDASDGLATGPFGSSVSSKYFVTEGVPLIRGSNLSADVGDRLVEDEFVFVTEAKASQFARAIAQRGDLVFTCWGTIGQVGLVDARSRFDRYLVSNKQMKLSPDPLKADSLFLYYLFSSPIVQGSIQNMAIGSSVPGFNLGQLRGIRFPLPTVSEQRAIADVLGSLDDKIEQNRRTGRKLEALARSVFKAWFVDFEPVKAKAAGAIAFPGTSPETFATLPTRLVDSELGLVPEGWEVKPLSAICTLVSGGTPKRSEATYWGGEVPWFSVKDAPADGMPWVYLTDEQITRKGLDESAANLVPIGTTIISARGTVGKLAMAGREMAFNQSCYGLLPSDGRSFRYLNLLMNDAVLTLQQRTHGSVFDTITRQTFDGIQVVVPPAGIMTTFDRAAAPFFDLQLAQLKESDKLAALRDYLLPRLLSGRVRVGLTNG